jgi:uncharacterized protein (DUF736 family)
MKRLFLLLVIVFFGLSGKIQAAGLQTKWQSSEATFSTQNGANIVNTVTTLTLSGRTSEPVASGQIQILLYAVATAGASPKTADGQADLGAYDLGLLSPSDITCPTSTALITFGAPDYLPASVTPTLHLGKYYHRLSCPFTVNSGPTILDFGETDPSQAITIDHVIQPLIETTNYLGNDFFAPIWVNITDPSGNTLLLQQLTATGGQSVQMRAEIAPQLSLTLRGLPANTSVCGRPNKNTTSGANANFGILATSSFTDIGQELQVITNSDSGYIVTVISDDQMRAPLASTTVCTGDGASNALCLPNAQVPAMSVNAAAAWTQPSQSGLAYTQDFLNGDDPSVLSFAYTQGYRHFPDAENSEVPEAILTTTTGRTSLTQLCYRAVANPNNADGGYSNQLTYTATAMF